MKPAIDIRNIRKAYGATVALKDVSLSVNAGELFGLIGPDGAGKTTLFRILTTLLLADSGEASVLGLDVVNDYAALRSRVGYMPGRFSLYQDLSVEENLHFFATVFNTSVAENVDLIRDIYMHLEPLKNRRAGKLSGGMKQKLALCCALVHKPDILFLDEPTTGVDAVSRKEFWDMLGRLRKHGITIMVSTPYMDEAAKCDRIALIQNGQILSINTPDGITARFPKPLFALKSAQMIRLLADLRAFPFIETVNAFGEWHHVTLKNDDEQALHDLEKYLLDKDHLNLEVHRIQPTVEDQFIRLATQKEMV
jgi:ABC-type multidrug transport system ATPase subunit